MSIQNYMCMYTYIYVNNPTFIYPFIRFGLYEKSREKASQDHPAAHAGTGRRRPVLFFAK